METYFAPFRRIYTMENTVSNIIMLGLIAAVVRGVFGGNKQIYGYLLQGFATVFLFSFITQAINVLLGSGDLFGWTAAKISDYSEHGTRLIATGVAGMVILIAAVFIVVACKKVILSNITAVALLDRVAYPVRIILSKSLGVLGAVAVYFLGIMFFLGILRYTSFLPETAYLYSFLLRVPILQWVDQHNIMFAFGNVF